MIHKIRKEKVYESNHGWLHSRFLFSFAEYFDESNVSWGKLRVFNDDSIEGYSGFPLHSHADMEIVTIMHRGTLTHEDSMGNRREIGPLFVQRMSAGTGVRHSEVNHGGEKIELYQLWFLPSKKSLTPEYEEKKFEEKEGLTLLVSPSGEEGSLSVHSAVKIYRGEIKKGEVFTIDLKKEEYILVYVRQGSISIKEKEYRERYQARISEEEKLEIVGEMRAQFFVVITG